MDDKSEPAAGPGPADHPFPLRKAGLLRNAGNQIVAVRERPEGDLAVFGFAGAASPRRKLLVLKLDHIGDFLMALPALETLRRAFRDDHITLLCGPWNVEFARAAGIADDIRVYRFFPEDGALWDGEPVEGVDRFRQIVAGPFDIAIDLRVDEDTRFLLKHVEAGLKCGIGARIRHPFLDVLLPAQFERRESDPPVLRIDPHRFQSRMKLKNPIFHETDFSTGNGHLIFGPDLVLPAGRFRAIWDLQLRAPVRRFPGVEIVVDVARNRGSEIVASRRLAWRRRMDFPSAAAVGFTNGEAGTAHEFRLHARGRPLWARLRFFGLWVERLDIAPGARFKPAELHVGEQLSLLVRLVEERLQPVRAGDLSPGELAEPIAWPKAAKRVVMAPVSNSRMRDWGFDNYARLAALLLESEDCAIALVGSPGQRDLLDGIVAQHGGDGRIVNLAGRTDWLQSAAIIREADLAISNNSGVGHLAAACGTPTLAIYSGSHQPQEWGPRGGAVRAVMALVPCSPCGYDRLELCPNDHLCMRMISPEAVAAEAIAMLSGAPRTRPGAAAV